MEERGRGLLAAGQLALAKLGHHGVVVTIEGREPSSVALDGECLLEGTPKRVRHRIVERRPAREHDDRLGRAREPMFLDVDEARRGEPAAQLRRRVDIALAGVERHVEREQQAFERTRSVIADEHLLDRDDAARRHGACRSGDQLLADRRSV